MRERSEERDNNMVQVKVFPKNVDIEGRQGGLLC